MAQPGGSSRLPRFLGDRICPGDPRRQGGEKTPEREDGGRPPGRRRCRADARPPAGETPSERRAVNRPVPGIDPHVDEVDQEVREHEDTPNHQRGAPAPGCRAGRSHPPPNCRDPAHEKIVSTTTAPPKRNPKLEPIASGSRPESGQGRRWASGAPSARTAPSRTRPTKVSGMTSSMLARTNLGQHRRRAHGERGAGRTRWSGPPDPIMGRAQLEAESVDTKATPARTADGDHGDREDARESVRPGSRAPPRRAERDGDRDGETQGGPRPRQRVGEPIPELTRTTAVLSTASGEVQAQHAPDHRANCITRRVVEPQLLHRMPSSCSGVGVMFGVRPPVDLRRIAAANWRMTKCDEEHNKKRTGTRSRRTVDDLADHVRSESPPTRARYAGRAPGKS